MSNKKTLEDAFWEEWTRMQRKELERNQKAMQDCRLVSRTTPSGLFGSGRDRIGHVPIGYYWNSEENIVHSY